MNISNNNSGQESTIKTIKKSYQTGHAMNVTNFGTLNIFLQGYDANFNPAREILKRSSLQELQTRAMEALTETNLAQSNYTLLVTEREQAFEGFNTLITNVYLALKALEPSTKIREDVMSAVHKLKGIRVKPKLSEDALAELADKEIEIKYYSVAQLGYDSRVENFDKLIALLSGISKYIPNETHLNVEGLKEKYNELKSKNNAVKESAAVLSNARSKRDLLLYHDTEGIYAVSNAVKSYVRAVYGLKSTQFKQIKNLVFRNIKR